MGPYLAPEDEQFNAADLLKEAQEFHALRLEQEEENFKAMADDLKMVGGDQWDAMARAERENLGLPVYSGNKFNTYLAQVTGEIRRNKPSVHVIPGDGAAKGADMAEVFEGIWRHAERASDAPSVYAAVGKSVTACGVGHCRLHHVFVSDWEAELRVSYIEDPFSVFWGEHKRFDQSDAKRCLVVTEMSKSDFDKKYPKHSSASWAQDRPYAEGSYSKWHCGREGKVTLAEYWVVKERPVKLTRVVHNQNWVDQYGQFQPPTGQETTLYDVSDEERAELARTGFTVIQEREDADREVCMYLLGGNSVIEHSVWPGQRIPIFTCVGEQIDRGDKIVTHGLIRYVKDPMKGQNLARSLQLQALGLSVKSPLAVDLEAIKGHEDIWNTAHRIPYPYLPFNSQNGKLPPPTRVNSASIDGGIASFATDMYSELQTGMGMFNASIGAGGNEKSGKAIAERDAQADTGTFVYFDNLNKMVAAIGQEGVNVAPVIMTAQKMLMIVGPDDVDGIVDIEELKAQGRALDIGKYLVVPKPGPAYQTRREKAVDRLVSMAQGAPDWAQPIIFKYIAKFDEMPNVDEFVEELERAAAMVGAPGFAPPAPMPGAVPPGAPLPPPQGGPPLPLPPPGRVPPLADLNFTPPGPFPASGPVVAPPEAGPPGIGA